jgi:D-tyrosyl-tRNA(Tyr) deacylase
VRAVVQRVSQARVTVGERTVAAIGPGLLVLVGVGAGDASAEAAWLARKVVELRIFEDEAGRMNRSVEEARGAVLVVSQFTLYGDCRKGRRPSFDRAMAAEAAEGLVVEVCRALRERGLAVERGEFGAAMDVALVNRGPVTLLLDSEKVF